MYYIILAISIVQCVYGNNLRITSGRASKSAIKPRGRPPSSQCLNCDTFGDGLEAQVSPDALEAQLTMVLARSPFIMENIAEVVKQSMKRCMEFSFPEGRSNLRNIQPDKWKGERLNEPVDKLSRNIASVMQRNTLLWKNRKAKLKKLRMTNVKPYLSTAAAKTEEGMPEHTEEYVKNAVKLSYYNMLHQEMLERKLMHQRLMKNVVMAFREHDKSVARLISK